MVRAWGPVVADPADPRWRGAGRLTIGTAEVSGTLEATLWALLALPHVKAPLGVTVRYDSEYAAGVVSGSLRAREHRALVEVAQRLVAALRGAGNSSLQRVSNLRKTLLRGLC